MPDGIRALSCQVVDLPGDIILVYNAGDVSLEA